VYKFNWLRSTGGESQKPWPRTYRREIQRHQGAPRRQVWGKPAPTQVLLTFSTNRLLSRVQVSATYRRSRMRSDSSKAPLPWRVSKNPWSGAPPSRRQASLRCRSRVSACSPAELAGTYENRQDAGAPRELGGRGSEGEGRCLSRYPPWEGCRKSPSPWRERGLPRTFRWGGAS